MSRYYWDKKTEADDLKKIEVHWLKRHRYLDPGVYLKSGQLLWEYKWSGTTHSIGITSSTLDTHEGGPHVAFNYTQTSPRTDEKTAFNYKVWLTSTPCRFGGKRWWFICPLTKNGVPCGRRVATLYKDGDYFGCRHCYNLTYDSRNQNRRSALYSLFNSFNYSQRLEKLYIHPLRPIYRGELTRRARRIITLKHKLDGNMSLLSQVGR